MIENILIVIMPSLIIIGIAYIITDKQFKKQLEILNKEKEALKKMQEKDEEENIKIEFEENNLEKYNTNDILITYKQNTTKKNKNNKKKNFYEIKKENEKKGREYELKVKKYYQDLGYEVFDNSKIYGKKDEGIDLIAAKKDEILFIQCKNWKKRKINHFHIKGFLADYILYLKKHRDEVIKYKKRKFILAIPDKILTKAAYARIKENNNIMDFIIIPDN